MFNIDFIFGLILCLYYVFMEMFIQPFRKLLQYGYCKSYQNIEGKTIVVTGSNTGIGYETAKECARRGARVIMTARDMKKGKIAYERIKREIGENVNLHLKYLNLSSLSSVMKFAYEILDEENIDILVNNAGASINKYMQSEDGYEMNFAVNYLAHFLLSLLLLDKISQSKNGKIINVSSILHFGFTNDYKNIHSSEHFTQFHSYANSKAAQILFTQELAKRCKGKINIYAVHPGTAATESFRYCYMWMQVLVNLFYMTAYQAAQTTFHCIFNEKADNETGFYYKECKVEKRSLFYMKPEMSKQMWDYSMSLLKENHNTYNEFIAKYPKILSDYDDNNNNNNCFDGKNFYENKNNNNNNEKKCYSPFKN